MPQSAKGNSKKIKQQGGYVNRHSRTSPTILKNMTTPPQVQEKVKEMYAAGCSMRVIQEELGVCAPTISKIVRAEDFDKVRVETREKIFGMVDDLLKSITYAVKNEPDGRLAHTVLRDLGILQEQTKQHKLQVEKGSVIDLSAADVEKRDRDLAAQWVQKFGVLTLEKAVVYGTSLPEEMPLSEKELKKIAGTDKD